MKKTISGPFLTTRQPNRTGRELESNEVGKHQHQEEPRPQANQRDRQTDRQRQSVDWTALSPALFTGEETQDHSEVMSEAPSQGLSPASSERQKCNAGIREGYFGMLSERFEGIWIKSEGDCETPRWVSWLQNALGFWPSHSVLTFLRPFSLLLSWVCVCSLLGPRSASMAELMSPLLCLEGSWEKGSYVASLSPNSWGSL